MESTTSSSDCFSSGNLDQLNTDLEGLNKPKEERESNGFEREKLLEATNDGYIQLKNPHIHKLDRDVLYHLDISTDEDLHNIFGRIRFVCFSGTRVRAQQMAQTVIEQIFGPGQAPPNFSNKIRDFSTIMDGVQDTLMELCDSGRYSMYRAGPVLCVSHGIGISSIQVLLHEITKILYYARARHVEFIRIGTSGGIGTQPGSLVISTQSVDGELNPWLTKKILGKPLKRYAEFSEELCYDLLRVAESLPEMKCVPVLCGKTMCAEDFYETQARLDGAICEITEPEKIAFLEKAYGLGVRNIEMESLAFAAFTHHLNIKAACICATLLDRLQGDQLVIGSNTIESFTNRAIHVVTTYISRELQHATG